MQSRLINNPRQSIHKQTFPTRGVLLRNSIFPSVAPLSRGPISMVGGLSFLETRFATARAAMSWTVISTTVDPIKSTAKFLNFYPLFLKNYIILNFSSTLLTYHRYLPPGSWKTCPHVSQPSNSNGHVKKADENPIPVKWKGPESRQCQAAKNCDN